MLDQLTQGPGQWVVPGVLEQVQRLPFLALVEVAYGGVREEIERAGDVLVLGEAPPLSGPAREKIEADEEDVDDRGRGLEEIVVVRGHELADLVDEESEPGAADHRGGLAPAPPDKGEQHPEGDHHQQAAPQQVRDVQLASAERRIVRQEQLQPDDQDHPDRRDQERVLELADLDVARGVLALVLADHLGLRPLSRKYTMAISSPAKGPTMRSPAASPTTAPTMWSPTTSAPNASPAADATCSSTNMATAVTITSR